MRYIASSTSNDRANMCHFPRRTGATLGNYALQLVLEDGQFPTAVMIAESPLDSCHHSPLSPPHFFGIPEADLMNTLRTL